MKIKSETEICDRKKNDTINRIEQFLKSNSFPILIFLVTLFVLLLINRPAIYLDDELITVNQLHQLTLGHQTLINECKYGCYPNGTPIDYFSKKHNVLGYTLFLPLLSVPVLTFFSFFGDLFRLPIILAWSLIPIILMMIISIGYPRYSRVAGFPIIYIGAIASIFLMMINIYYYHPFPFSAPDAPSESGAVILTNAIICSLLSVVVYQLSLLIWNNKRVSLISTVSILCCSSFFFWSGTAKDHILMTFLLSLVTYFFIRSIITNNKNNRYAAFFCIGLLAWIRPEIGLSILMGSIVYLILERFIDPDISENFYLTLRDIILFVMATCCGSIPLFINNLITTKNIFIPPFYYYMSETAPAGIDITNAGSGISNTNELVLATSGSTDISSVFHIFPLIASYFSSIPVNQLITSVMQIFVYRESGDMTLFVLTPLFLSGLVLLIGVILLKRPVFPTRDIKILAVLSLFIIFVFVAYGKSLPNIGSSYGIVPDMRYFLPVYFLGGLIGFYPLARWGKDLILHIAKPKYLLVLCTMSIIVALSVIMFMKGSSLSEYNAIYQSLIFGFSLFFICLFYAYKSGRCGLLLVGLVLIIMISLPLSWQLFINFHEDKLFGYPNWIPYIEYLVEKYIQYKFIY